ncbi:MAG: hypothetical protein HEQ19_25385 [Gloeotrichia echinulata CP02]|jgi:hypothetical protein
MKLPIQSQPIVKGANALAAKVGVAPSFMQVHEQCCGNLCMKQYCFLGVEVQGCIPEGRPFVKCIGGGMSIG